MQKNNHILDNPMWQTLATHQAKFAIGNQLALRYQPDVAPFAGIQAPTAEAYAALAALIGADELLYFLGDEAPQLACCKVEGDGLITQMVWQGATNPPEPNINLTRLGAPDVQEMLTLTALAFPGYFRARTYELGAYWGVRVNGLLVAMAGERFAIENYCEVSAVCTHPDFRGRGYAEQLVCRVVNDMRKRGAIPFLHVGKHNDAAKRIYEKLGFVERCDLPLWAISKQPSASESLRH